MASFEPRYRKVRKKNAKYTIVSQLYPTSDKGPSPRSCHRMCYDPQTDTLFVLGRYVGQKLQSPPVESDFFKYDLKQNKWVKLCDHTAVSLNNRFLYQNITAWTETWRTGTSI